MTAMMPPHSGVETMPPSVDVAADSLAAALDASDEAELPAQPVATSVKAASPLTPSATCFFMSSPFEWSGYARDPAIPTMRQRVQIYA
jgi:hypothetical protein